MNEFAFIVKPGSSLYRKYFTAKAERKKFCDLHNEFVKKHDLESCHCFYTKKRLSLDMSQEQRRRFEGQILKYTDENGMTSFKKNSKMQKDWEAEVASCINFDVLSDYDFWWIDFITSGSYKLWNNGDVLYGYILDRNYGPEKAYPLESEITRIKLSEYYQAIEEMEVKHGS